MRTMFRGAAGVLLPLLAVTPAAAQDAPPIVVEAPLIHPAAGLMNEHVHEGGEIMVGLRLERQRFSGANRSGTDTIDDAAIHAAGYTARTASMEMDMVMLDLMVGVTDAVTVMVMPHYMWHRMEMVGIDPGASGADGHGGTGQALPFGAVHSHSSEGFGDTLVSASYRLLRRPGLGAHATLGVWLPTGAVDKRNPNGTFVHYGMQPGSGTWDVEPAVTVRGGSGALGWGVQGAYRWRTEDANASGFAFGDRARATGWLSTLAAPGVGATARLEYVHEGAIEGQYDGPHSHASPPDRPANYGGDTVSAALGLNWLLPVGGASHPQLGLEIAVPLYQDLNGIQAPQDWRGTVSVSHTF